MPVATWYLKFSESDQDWVKIEIDPMAVSGQSGQLSRTLCFPYTLTQPGRPTRAVLHLLSVEGWLGGSGEADYVGRIRIPSQVISNNPNRPWFLVPVTDEQIAAIEEIRKGNPANFTLWFAGLATVVPVSQEAATKLQRDGIGTVTPVESSGSYLTVPRERWLEVLNGLGTGTRQLVELPEARLPRGMDVWTECLRLLDEATRFHQLGDYEHTLINCRAIAEGIPQVLCSVWGVPQKTTHQSVSQWLRTVVEPQLTAAWPEDRKGPGMLRTMLTGAWEWTAPAPHYGTEMPLREKSTFALHLSTDLLHFAGQMLKAHPDPVVVPAAIAP